MKLIGAGLLLCTLMPSVQAAAPACEETSQRSAIATSGAVQRGQGFAQTLAERWTLRLDTTAYGWIIRVNEVGRDADDLARLTPPWHSVPNERELDGWHFRNSANTGPNSGDVNAPQQLRTFIFSPEVGRTIEYNGSATSEREVETVRAYGQGWLYIERYTLTTPGQGDKAAFDRLEFTACLTWPRD